MSLLLLFNQLPYHLALLDTARELLRANHRENAVVTAMIACEIFTEQVFSAVYRKKGLAHLEDPIHALHNNYSLGNERMRDLYVVLTGDEIQLQPFWSKFKEAASRRNRVVHKGHRVSSEEAQDTCDIARQLVAHLETVLQTF